MKFICRSSEKDRDIPIRNISIDVPQRPVVGDYIAVDGETYRVEHVTWAFGQPLWHEGTFTAPFNAGFLFIKRADY